MRIRILMTVILSFSLFGCSKLDLNPLAEGSSETWYSNDTEFEMALNDLFREVFWERDNDLWSDDLSFRGEVNSMNAGTMNAENGSVETAWRNKYKAISRAITILENLDGASNTISDANLAKYEANARFVIASQYAYLISHWGDVPYVDKSIGIEEAYEMGRTDKEIILQAIYENYDLAASLLPVSYDSDELKYATKGAALALKARIALYMGDYATARDAAKACMDLGIYDLNPDFRNQFLSSTKNSNETIFAVPRSVELGAYENETKYYITRLAGGFGSRNPTYGLFSAFLDSEGNPIDESDIYNPRKPFENRDPRLKQTFVEHGTPWLGYIWQPHPDSLKVREIATGKMVTNKDTRANVIHAPFNGLIMKKGIDEDYSDDYRADPDLVLVRYADVLLMYAEAKIELNEIDASVLEAMNKVRARAYETTANDVTSYPDITTTNQSELREILRFERRMELAFEGLRYMDLIRWKLAEEVFNTPEYGMLDVAELRSRVVEQGLWFFPGIPEIDGNAISDFSAIEQANLIKVYGIRSFDAAKNYLWPIPAKDVLINDNMEQNPNY